MRETAHRKRNQLGCRLKRFYAFVYARRVGRDRNARQPVAQRIRLRPRIILRPAVAAVRRVYVKHIYTYISQANTQRNMVQMTMCVTFNSRSVRDYYHVRQPILDRYGIRH